MWISRSEGSSSNFNIVDVTLNVIGYTDGIDIFELAVPHYDLLDIYTDAGYFVLTSVGWPHLQQDQKFKFLKIVTIQHIDSGVKIFAEFNLFTNNKLLSVIWWGLTAPVTYDVEEL